MDNKTLLKRRSGLYIVMAVVLGIILLFIAISALHKQEPVTLSLALYQYVPDYESFEDTVREYWKEIHPDVELSFVDWDCYGVDLPEDIDVFVFDAVNLDFLAEAGCLLPLSEEDIPVFYVDVASINAGISDQKKELAFELLNVITSGDLLSEVSDQDGDIKYLLAARTSVYDSMIPSYPIYEELKEIALVPEAYVFRVKPGGNAFIEGEKKNAGLLPALHK